MKRVIGLFAIIAIGLLASFGCGSSSQNAKEQNTTPAPTPEPPKIPATLTEILDNKNTESRSRLFDFDFQNLTYPLPRGWQDVDSKEITLENGARRMTEEKIGMSYVTKKFGDVTGDGNDEAFVILRVLTGGSATPHIVYVFEWIDGKPDIIWYFRTGDRADGGLKRIYAEEGELVVELFGQDRYIFNQMETLKIIGEDQQLCCPVNFTKTNYKRISNGFALADKRLTYSLTEPDLPPHENLGEKNLRESRGKN